MQNYCKCIIPHAKLQLHNISVSLYHVDTNLLSRENGECTKHEKFNTQVNLLLRRWTLDFFLLIGIICNAARKAALHFSNYEKTFYQILVIMEVILLLDIPCKMYVLYFLLSNIILDLALSKLTI